MGNEGYLGKSLDIILLNRRTMQQAGSDRKATFPAALILVASLGVSEAVFAISSQRTAVQVAYDVLFGALTVGALFCCCRTFLPAPLGAGERLFLFSARMG